MIRDLGQPVSALDLQEDSVIAGGWNGALRKWNGDGDLIWKAQCSDRIESILRIEDLVVVTSGLHISCVKSGEIIWSEALEGSADLLAFYDGEIVPHLASMISNMAILWKVRSGNFLWRAK